MAAYRMSCAARRLRRSVPEVLDSPVQMRWWEPGKATLGGRAPPAACCHEPDQWQEQPRCAALGAGHRAVAALFGLATRPAGAGYAARCPSAGPGRATARADTAGVRQAAAGAGRPARGGHATARARAATRLASTRLSATGTAATRVGLRSAVRHWRGRQLLGPLCRSCRRCRPCRHRTCPGSLPA